MMRYLAPRLPLATLIGVVLLSAACESEKKAEAPAKAKTAAAVVPPEPPADPHRNDYKKPTAEGKVFFEGVKDGGKVEGKNIMGMVAANLIFKVEGMSVAEEGPVAINTGHFFVIIDGEPVAESKVAEEGAKARKFGKGQVKGIIPLPEGKHTLTLQFVDARDRSYGKNWSSTVNITAVSEK